MTDMLPLEQQLAQLNRPARIAIIGAMDEEIIQIKSALEQANQQKIADYPFFTGKLFQQDIILLKSGIGKVNAAIGTALLLQEFSPDLILNTGSAGGLDPQLSIGNIVVSNQVRHHDVDVTAFGYEPGQVPGSPASFTANEFLAAQAVMAIKKLAGVQAVIGEIASGDSFMHDPQRVNSVKELFSNIKALEMEAAAIAQCCHQFSVPFLIVRALSDIAGQKSEQSFEEFLPLAAQHSTQMLLLIIEQLSQLQER